MDHLQLGLALIGGLVLAVVVAHGAWVSRKNTPRQAQPSEPGQAAQAGDAQREPQFVDSSWVGLSPLPASGGAAAQAGRKSSMDALIDVIATLTPDPLAGSVLGDAVLAAMPATRRVGTKPFAVEGYNLATSGWEAPTSGQRYSLLQVGVQLANRAGALNDIEYSEFVVKAQAFADALACTPEFPEMRDEVARARELDQFASAHDAQLGFQIRARNASWSPGYVQQNAARLGFVPGLTPGRMVLPSSVAGLPPLLALTFDPQAALAEDPAQTAIREIGLHLDVAQVDRAERPFERMRDAAYALAQQMDGTVTDDNGQALPPQTMDVIATELQTLYDTLEQRDLAAGSLLARRLFS